MEPALMVFGAMLIHGGLITFLFLKKQIKQPTGRCLLGYLSFSFIWNLFGLLDWFNVIPPFTMIYPLVSVVFASCYFAYCFLKRNKPNLLWQSIPGGIGLIAILILGFVPLNFLPVSFSNIVIDRDNSIFWLGLVLIISYLGLALTITLKSHYQTTSPSHRNRIQFLFLSLLVLSSGLGFYLTGSDLNQYLGVFIQSLASVAFVYINLKQNLPDIRRTLRKVLALSVIYIFKFLIYLVISYLVLYFFESPLASQWPTIFLLAITLTLVSPFRRMAQDYLSEFLFKPYDYQAIVKAYIQKVNNVLVLDDFVDIALSFIRDNTEIERGAFFLLTGEDENHYQFEILSTLNNDLPDGLEIFKQTLLAQKLVDEGTSLAQYTLDLKAEFHQGNEATVEILKNTGFEYYFPIMRQDELAAILGLGPLTSGLPYRPDDIELFKTIADQTGILLENVRLFENVRHNLDENTRIKDLMENIFASIKSGVITINNREEITVLNRTARRILNLPREVQTGSQVNLLFEHLKSTPLPTLFKEVQRTQSHYFSHEMDITIASREIVTVDLSLAPVKNAQNELKGIAIIINDLTEHIRLKTTQSMFRKYLSPAVVDRLPNDPSALKLGGQRQEVTILFADLRGFSTFSEYESPENLINILNQYFTLAAEAILAYEGTLDKFMGDAIMAIFNAPLPQSDHTLRAVKAAAAMQRALHEFHLSQDEPTGLRFGVGLHVGDAVIGNVGTHNRMDYTAIGDAVNLAKRIQENTPGGRIFMSADVYQRVQASVNAILFDEIKVKGRQTSEQIYDLLNIL